METGGSVCVCERERAREREREEKEGEKEGGRKRLQTDRQSKP